MFLKYSKKLCYLSKFAFSCVLFWTELYFCCSRSSDFISSRGDKLFGRETRVFSVKISIHKQWAQLNKVRKVAGVDDTWEFVTRDTGNGEPVSILTAVRIKRVNSKEYKLTFRRDK